MIFTALEPAFWRQAQRAWITILLVAHSALTSSGRSCGASNVVIGGRYLELLRELGTVRTCGFGIALEGASLSANLTEAMYAQLSVGRAPRCSTDPPLVGVRTSVDRGLHS